MFITFKSVSESSIIPCTGSLNTFTLMKRRD